MQDENSKSSRHFNMDAELKQALIDKIKSAEKDLRSPRVVKALLENHARKTRVGARENHANNPLYEMVGKRFRDRSRWKIIRDALAEYGFESFRRKMKRMATAEQNSAARGRQLGLFPGFESLPTRIRSGSKYVSFSETSVPQFLAYEKQYQERAAKSRRTADELHELAEQVRPFAGDGLPLAEAFDRARKQAAKFGAASPLPALAG